MKSLRYQSFAIVMATMMFIAYQMAYNPKYYFPYCYVRQHGLFKPTDIGTPILNQSCLYSKTDQLTSLRPDCYSCLVDNGILTLMTAAILILLPLFIGTILQFFPGTTLVMLGSWIGILYALHYYNAWGVALYTQ